MPLELSRALSSLNAAGQALLRSGDFAEAEGRFRSAIDLYAARLSVAHAASSITVRSVAGLVRSLKAQGRHAEATVVSKAYRHR